MSEADAGGVGPGERVLAPAYAHGVMSGGSNIVLVARGGKNQEAVRAARERRDYYDPYCCDTTLGIAIRNGRKKPTSLPMITGLFRVDGKHHVETMRLPGSHYDHVTELRQTSTVDLEPPHVTSTLGMIAARAGLDPDDRSLTPDVLAVIAEIQDKNARNSPLNFAPDEPTTAENIYWKTGQLLHSDMVERFGQDVLDTVGLPSLEVINDLVPRPRSLGPEDPGARPMLNHCDLKKSNYLITNQPLATALEEMEYGRPFLNKYRDTQITPLLKRRLAQLKQARADYPEMPALLEFDGSSAQTPWITHNQDPVEHLDEMVRLTESLMELDLDSQVQSVDPRLRIDTAFDCLSFLNDLATIPAEPIARLAGASMTAREARLMGNVPDGYIAAMRRLYRSCTILIDPDPVLLTYCNDDPDQLSPQRLFDLAVAIRREPDESEVRMISQWERLIDLVDRDDLHSELLTVILHSVRCDLMRFSEGRVDVDVPVSALGDFLEATGLAHWLQEPSRRRQAAARAVWAAEASRTLTAWREQYVQEHGSLPEPIPPFERVTESEPNPVRPPVIEVTSTEEHRERARQLSGTSDPDPVLVAACAVEDYVQEQAVAYAQAAAKQARQCKAEAATLHARFADMHAAYRGHLARNGVDYPEGPLLIRHHMLAQQRKDATQQRMLSELITVAQDWRIAFGAADLAEDEVRGTVVPAYADELLGWTSPALAADAGTAAQREHVSAAHREPARTVNSHLRSAATAIATATTLGAHTRAIAPTGSPGPALPELVRSGLTSAALTVTSPPPTPRASFSVSPTFRSSASLTDGLRRGRPASPRHLTRELPHTP